MYLLAGWISPLQVKSQTRLEGKSLYSGFPESVYWEGPHEFWVTLLHHQIFPTD